MQGKGWREASRPTRAEAIARQLELEIRGGWLQAGVRIGTKDELRLRFGAAPATINEAIRLLTARGLVAARPGPGGGIFVAVPSLRLRLDNLVLGFRWEGSSVSECFEVLHAMEPLVWREAARGRRPGDLPALEKILARMEKCLESPSEFAWQHREFHRRYSEACRNRPLRGFYLLLFEFVFESLEGSADTSNFEENLRLDSLQAHRELVQALGRGEGPELEAAIERHAALTGLFLGSYVKDPAWPEKPAAGPRAG